ncbi:ead/Ea22-like family protein [Serratia sp. MF2]|uniref:ead/Ea22-like family protein n=1 Tax=Serratia sp. MF2 TaxID=3059173 RepID=UPI0027FFFD76|nr:ead/Ea22-like family protein [Serratia sp. MF2]MDQ7101463.1 ead/Ea22-like family protein [Serratia sp. MF2]
MDKFSELKAAAMAATPGPWEWFTSNSMARLSSTPSGKDGDVLSAFRASDGVPCVSVSQYDMAFIASANPAAVLAMLADLEAKDERIGELEAIATEYAGKFQKAQDALKYAAIMSDEDKKKIAELEKRLATPVRLLGEMLVHEWEHSVERQATFQHRKIAWDARLAEDKKAILAAGFTFTVEGDE